MTERFWLSLPLACVGIAALSLPAMAQSGDESPFLLQEHGGVRILRGLDADKNFEATPAEEDEKAEAPEKEARPEKAASVASSKTKRTGIASPPTIRAAIRAGELRASRPTRGRTVILRAWMLEWLDAYPAIEVRRRVPEARCARDRVWRHAGG